MKEEKNETFYVYQGVTVSGLYVFKDKQPDYMTKDCVEHKCISVDKDLDSYIYFIQHQHDVVKKENAELTRKVADYEAALKRLINSNIVKQAPFIGYCESYADAIDVLNKYGLRDE